MDEKEEIAGLRTHLKSTGRLNLEFKGGLSALLREYGIEVSDSTLAKLTIALPDEIGSSVSVVLPEPSQPPVGG